MLAGTLDPETQSAIDYILVNKKDIWKVTNVGQHSPVRYRFVFLVDIGSIAAASNPLTAERMSDNFM
jgi:hypothetical protein